MQRVTLWMIVLLWQVGAWAGHPLPEGLYLKGLEARLIDPCGAQPWSLEVETTWIRGDYEVPVGARWILLPTSALQEITESPTAQEVEHWRLYGRVTRYRGQSFLYLERGTPRLLIDPNVTASSEPNELVEAASAIGIPKGLVESMEARPDPSAANRGWPSEPTGDNLWVDRVGSLVSQEGRWYFRPDSLGRRESGQMIEVLPSQTRERMEQMQAAGGREARFRIVALQTEYQDKPYILLLRAVRVYSRGNFGT